MGSLSIEVLGAHAIMAMAMNKLGGEINTGGGEEYSDRCLNQEPEF